MNTICLIGRAGTTPELKTLPSGATVTNFNLAVPKKHTARLLNFPIFYL